MNILLTGGAGYIGSHIATLLLEIDSNIVIYDNFSNSDRGVINKIASIAQKKVIVIEGDILNVELMAKTMTDFDINSVIHLAGLKSVPESIESPIEYFQINVGGIVALLAAMKKAKVFRMIFSSSANVYGEPLYVPIDENHSVNPLSVYGKTKLQSENILRDVSSKISGFQFLVLRYFNPVGAHPSGAIGESPKSIPGNLLPYISLVALGRYAALNIYGNDYSTIDGTGVRDYIHVMDLAEAHVMALQYLCKSDLKFDIVNIGTGEGYSVVQIKDMYESIIMKNIKCDIKNRRLGDVAECYANPNKAKQLFGWAAKKTLADMCESAWKFYNLNVLK